MADQRFNNVKYKKDGSADYEMRLGHLQNISNFLATLNLAEIDHIGNVLASLREKFLKDEKELMKDVTTPG